MGEGKWLCHSEGLNPAFTPVTSRPSTPRLASFPHLENVLPLSGTEILLTSLQIKNLPLCETP